MNKTTIFLLLALAVMLSTYTHIHRGHDYLIATKKQHARIAAAAHALKPDESDVEAAEEEEAGDDGYGADDDADAGDESEADDGSDADDGYGAENGDASKEENTENFEGKFAQKGEKNWHVPNMKPLGFFRGQAGLNADGINKTILETTFKPTMIPTDGFGIRAAKPMEKNDTGLSPFVPKTVPHGELKEIRAQEDAAEDSEVEGDIKMKSDELKNTQVTGACALMTNALELARAARTEEEAAKGEGKALVDIIKMVCPSLKFHFSFVMRCKVCAKMMARLEKFYAPGFDTKVFPGLAHPEKCDKGKWPSKNFGTSLVF
jgi:hypothetical protein